MPKQRVALITGGIAGLGTAVAKSLNAAGYRIAVTNTTDSDKNVKFSQEMSLPHFVWDVSDFSACEVGISDVEHELGPIDILINNASVTPDATFHNKSLDDWHTVLNDDLDLMFHMCCQTIGGMRERGFGRIINISSVNAFGGPIGHANYCAAKAGVIRFTKALALENALMGITVNAVVPDYRETSMAAVVPKQALAQVTAPIPVGRLNRPEDIARVVAFLASDDGRFITGATVSTNGKMDVY